MKIFIKCIYLASKIFFIPIVMLYQIIIDYCYLISYIFYKLKQIEIKK